jgi:hypothetical protein
LENLRAIDDVGDLVVIWSDNIKMVLKEIGCDGVQWFIWFRIWFSRGLL